MKRIVAISEVVDCREVLKGTREVIASGEASFDEEHSELTVQLGSRVLLTDPRGKETKVTEDWLPHPETIREKVPLEEAQALARDVFSRWAAKVRRVVPAAIPV